MAIAEVEPPERFKIWYPPGRLPGGSLEIRGLGRNEAMPPCLVDRPRGTVDWMFVAFHDGVELMIAGEPRTLDGPVLMAWPPNRAHWYGRSGVRWTHTWMHVRGPALEALVGTVSLPRACPILGFPVQVAVAVTAALYAELARPDPDPILARLHLEVLVRAAARAAAPPTLSAPPPWPEIRRFIDEHHALRLTLAGLGRHFGLSAAHLCDGFRRWFGVPPIEYLIRLRLDRARVLLSDRNRSVAAVAAEVGWRDVPHFTRLFRRRCGVTPGSLRD